MKHTEAEVARVAMDRMVAEGWDCYPEVVLPCGARADIVGVRRVPFCSRDIVMIVECKTSWTLKLLEQGERAIAHAHYVMLAAPTKSSIFYERLCMQRGIGMLRFMSSADLKVDEYRCVEPRRIVHRGKSRIWGPERTLQCLHEDQKRYDPGTTAAAGYSTPWRRTMDGAAKYIAKNPGITVKELIAAVDWHYSSVGSARQGFLLWLDQRDDVEARRDGREIRFYPI